MENLSQIVDFVGRTNLFNFVIFLSIIILIYKKLNVTDKVEASAQTIKEIIDKSENVKAESEEHLNEIEKSIANIENDINEIINQSEKNAKLVGTKVLEDAQKTAVAIRENTTKALQNSRELLKNDLLKRAALASVEVAKAHIRQELEINKDLHTKLIDESLDAIEGVEL